MSVNVFLIAGSLLETPQMWSIHECKWRLVCSDSSAARIFMANSWIEFAHRGISTSSATSWPSVIGSSSHSPT